MDNTQTSTVSTEPVYYVTAIRYSARKQNVYAELRTIGTNELTIAATLEDLIYMCSSRKYRVANLQEKPNGDYVVS